MQTRLKMRDQPGIALKRISMLANTPFRNLSGLYNIISGIFVIRDRRFVCDIHLRRIASGSMNRPQESG